MFIVDNRNLTWSYDNYIGDDYYIFVLGYDILNWKFKNIEMTCDEAFDIACEIYDTFKKFEAINGYADCSTYESLWDFADQYIDKFILHCGRF